MTRWEFHEVTIYHGHELEGRRELEERGRNGWQIGGVVHFESRDAITFYMQRATPQAGDAPTGEKK